MLRSNKPPPTNIWRSNKKDTRVPTNLWRSNKKDTRVPTNLWRSTRRVLLQVSCLTSRCLYEDACLVWPSGVCRSTRVLFDLQRFVGGRVSCLCYLCLFVCFKVVSITLCYVFLLFFFVLCGFHIRIIKISTDSSYISNRNQSNIIISNGMGTWGDDWYNKHERWWIWSVNIILPRAPNDHFHQAIATSCLTKKEPNLLCK
jgi:hypothetical protein